MMDMTATYTVDVPGSLDGEVPELVHRPSLHG
jgi:hypothetical protein